MSINWNFEKRGRGQAILSHIRVRYSSGKTETFTITFPKELYIKLGEPNFVCFGMDSKNIYLTTKPIGTQFFFSKKAKENQNYVINSMSVVKSIIGQFHGRAIPTHIGLKPVQINDGEWKLQNVDEKEVF